VREGMGRKRRGTEKEGRERGNGWCNLGACFLALRWMNV